MQRARWAISWKRREQPREFLERAGASARPPVAREDERLRVEDRHVEIFRAVPHVRRQSGCQLKPTYLPMRLFGSGQQRRFGRL